MFPATLLINTATGYEIVKRRLKGLLRVMEQGVPAIENCTAQRTGLIRVTIENHGNITIRCVCKREIVKVVGGRIVELLLP